MNISKTCLIFAIVALFSFPAFAKPATSNYEDALFSVTVFFSEADSAITEESAQYLDDLAAMIELFPENKVTIEGHADSRAYTKGNLKLSQERAKAVYDYLAAKGLPKERMILRGWSDTKPSENNDTDYGKSKNRRVEIIVLGN